MDENHRWTGIITVALAIVGVGVLIVYNGPNNSSGLIASIFLILWGIFVYWSSDIGKLNSDSSWIDGLFWIVVGVVIIILMMIFESTRLRVRRNGIIIGIFLIAIGVYQLIELRQR